MHELDLLCVNTIRALSIDMIQKANSGHPGLPLGAAPFAYVLWTRWLRHNPDDPKWFDRDRFVLSAGHGSALLYSLLHLTGYDVSLDDIKDFRQWGSKTPGHPESFMTPGVEATTGPLGQGTANAVGMAIAERYLANLFNRPGHTIIDHYTYALVSDGDLMEGIAAEAASLAGHLGLGKLIFLYDSNDISLDGPTSLSFTKENVLERFDAYGWQAMRVEDGNTDIAGIDAAIGIAKAETSKPSIIEFKTTIGYGSPAKAGSSASHGAPLGEDEIVRTKKQLGWEWPEKVFHVPEQVTEKCREISEHGAKLQDDWNKRFDSYKAEFPDLADQFVMAFKNELPEKWDSDLPEFSPGEKLATRAASGKTIQAISAEVPWLFGSDADLSSSTKGKIDDGGSFDGLTGEGRNLRCGVREHAMAAISNGILWHGGMRPFTSTFFVFSDYMKPSVRLAAMNGLPEIYIWTHDSVHVGEDGPTHQPIEQLAMLRAIPNLMVVRPCDANEAVEAWRFAMNQKDHPTALVFTRQGLPVLDRSNLAPATELHRGAYVISEANGEPKAIIIATGSEVHIALDAKAALEADGIPTRVVSMPGMEVFSEQDEAYRESVIPSSVTAKVSVEAGVTYGWCRWTGSGGVNIGIDKFGASAPGNIVAEKYGMTSGKIVDAVKSLV